MSAKEKIELTIVPREGGGYSLQDQHGRAVRGVIEMTIGACPSSGASMLTVKLYDMRNGKLSNSGRVRAYPCQSKE